MRKASIKKITLYVLILLAVLYLLCFIISMAAAFNIQTLTYRSTGWGVVLAEYQLDFADDLTELNYFDFDGTLSSHTENTFSTSAQIKVKFICAVALMPLWKNEYNNPFVQDGDHWHTIMSYNDKTITTYGSNSYPLTYGLVYHVIMSVFDIAN